MLSIFEAQRTRAIDTQERPFGPEIKAQTGRGDPTLNSAAASPVWALSAGAKPLVEEAFFIWVTFC
eukprot:3143110-Alexandrium_andersonii.AAC.1